VTALPDGHDRSGPLVSEQDGERVVPPVLFDHVQVAVTDPGGLDADEPRPRPRLVAADLLERDRAGPGEDYAAVGVSHERSRSRIECPPARARLRSIFAIRFCMRFSTPRCPQTAR